jgi:hypothetical protein
MAGKDEAPRNEGEGNRTADRNYRAGVKETLERRDVEKETEAARREVESNPEAFKRAEETGRAMSAGEAPGDLKRSGQPRELQEPEDA